MESKRFFVRGSSIHFYAGNPTKLQYQLLQLLQFLGRAQPHVLPKWKLHPLIGFRIKILEKGGKGISSVWKIIFQPFIF